MRGQGSSKSMSQSEKPLAPNELRRIILNMVYNYRMFDQQEILRLAADLKKHNQYLDKS